MISQNEYFYCYSHRLFRFLKMEKKIIYICAGLNDKTLLKFWLFKTSDELTKALIEYTQKQKD